MRMSAAKIKGIQGSTALKDRPDPSRPLGRLYDYFLARPLTVVTIDDLRSILPKEKRGNVNVSGRVESLQNFYGMTIQHVGHGEYRLIATEDRDFLAEGVERLKL